MVTSNMSPIIPISDLYCCFESLVLHQEFRETGKRKFMKLAKDEHLVRFHIGLEDPNDLVADIKQALRHLK